jgi:tocopherol O-methyltransferase
MKTVHYYSAKTSKIIRKYGPGPRIHYHVGVYPRGILPSMKHSLLQRQIVQGQEDMMLMAAEHWGMASGKGKRFLDVGAGLGGASLWMAMNKGASVDALVQCPEHGEVIRELAMLSGCGEQIRILVGDAHDTPQAEEASYDAIFAMESPCYFDRERWFRHIASLLKEGGKVGLEDVFLGEDAPASCKRFFDGYWKTDIGTLSMYRKAAEAAGFRVSVRDITEETTPFWALSAAWSRAEEAECDDAEERERLKKSVESSLFHLQAWKERKLQIALLSLERCEK